MRIHESDFSCLYFKLQAKFSIAEFGKDLLDELRRRFPDQVKGRSRLAEIWNALSQMFKRVKLGPVVDIETGSLSFDGSKLLSTMAEALNAVGPDKAVVILDEFSDFLLHLNRVGTHEVEHFLTWLRDVRQRGNARFIITGSINVISTVREMNFYDLINDLREIELIPFSDTEVKDMLAKLLQHKKIELEPKALEFAADKLRDGIPYNIQKLADEISTRTNAANQSIDKEELAHLYARIVGGSNTVFENHHSRLRKYLNQIDCSAAEMILAHLCDQPMSFEDLYPYTEQLVPERKRLHLILKRLEDEGYLASVAGTYDYVSPMLRDWWKNHYLWEREA
jgi:hypothetical protein